MKIKVCGMRQSENITAVASLDIDLMGFIFFDRSPRYVNTIAPESGNHIGRVGVFVNESIDNITKIAQRNHLTHLQLHGTESAAMCGELGRRGFTIIKAFQITTPESFAQCVAYQHTVDLLLFDTASGGYGGSGAKFDWSSLSGYTGDLPYILSGGISVDDVEKISQIDDSRLWGVDLNSCFERAPALKNVELLNKFINQLKTAIK